MSITRFERHLKDPAPAFRCYAAGDKQKEIKWLASITNRIGPGGSQKAMDTLTRLIGNASPALMQFVKLHDGIELYCDNLSDCVGIEFFKVEEYNSRTEEMRKSMIDMGFDATDMPDWFREGIVIGEIPQSGNYFAIQPTGANKGSIFYCDHDDFITDPIAVSFDALIDQIAKDPPSFLYLRGCYARYSDGKTRSQWIPKDYVPDSSSI